MIRRGCFRSALSLALVAPVLVVGCSKSESPQEVAVATPAPPPAAAPPAASNPAPAGNAGASNSSPSSTPDSSGGYPQSSSPSSGSSSGSGSSQQDGRAQQQQQAQQAEMARQAEMQKQMEEQQRMQQRQQEEQMRQMQEQQLAQQQQQQQMQAQQQQQYGGQPGAVVEELPKTLRGRAERAYSLGHEKKAYQLLQAAALASPSESEAVISAVKWATPRNQPQLGLRIAVGVDYKGPTGLTDFKPIGSNQAIGGQGQGQQQQPNYGSSSSSSSSGPSGPSGNEKGKPSVEQLAGTMGTALIKHMRELHKEGKWSIAFKGVNVKAGEVSTATNNPQQYESSSSSSYGSSGGPAPALESAAAKRDADDGKTVPAGPALGYIGIDTTANLVKTAKKEGFDGLVVFDVTVSVNRRSGVIGNECKAKLINLSDGKPMASSKALRNTDVQKELQKNDGDGGVEKAMQPVIDKLDEKFALNDLPSVITADVIKSKRLGTLITDRSKPKLDALMEIKLYQSKGFLGDGEVELAFDAIVGGDDAKKLLSGTEAEKEAAAEKLIGK